MKLMKLRNIAMLLALGALTGCDFMDCDESSDYSKEQIFDSFERSKRMVTNIYSYLPHDFCNTADAMQDAATDDAVHVYKSSNIWYFVNGSWSANHTVDDVWEKYYTAIRSANLYLKESEGQNFEDWKFSDGYEDMMKDFNNYRHEVRFLRAFYYFELIKRYHQVPLILDVLSPEQANQVKPASFEEVAKFILDECTDLAKDGMLPINYNDFKGKETGRITKGAAMALKSRVTLYMASPLFSEPNVEKWKIAARAANDLIKKSGILGYKLIPAYANLFLEKAPTRQENILVRPIGESGDFEKANFPMGVEGGKTSTCPTQNLVDAYEMRDDGSKFDWNNPAHRQNPYANRDPRLGYTIVYNDVAWPGSKKVEIWEGGVNGLPLTNATVTGYYLRKYVNKSISFASGSQVKKKQHFWVLFRYAEILLNYAEAMVNAYDDPDFVGDGFDMSARQAVNMIRKRVSMPEFPQGMSTQEFLERLKNERRVELAFEGHRFWDVRRWKDLDKTSDIYGVKVTKDGTGFNYEKFLYERRTITENLYFYPISNTEMYKNTNLIQNPGW
ncbi:RagB/SusD domain-containing protein [gut metagenome]|uniref:RagB/SusD domain-containing protein n=1 Tax=gut metagenome TaxID=749906 RepID=J9GHF3_9ZZZZ